ncbi:MAG: Asp-tRNA(Asn)/Glu-tRNA(Gln) amidotransferase subunit GatB [Oscillospiraceae bacterium]|nr:Asp-tRNA(Asn)/Glu-tRNA(Gln) amidotransferase subunit GatB [Oscillospiraceae bacterium]
MTKYETVIGLEVHVELATQTKLFCSCSAKFGADANENVCPACMGMPGMLPVANRKAMELGIAAALVTNSEIIPVMSFDKKNYFYPDLPTGYQITQFFAPICRNGYVDISVDGENKRITLKQIHIEEDAGKLVHRHGMSLVDYNRAGVPLVEIVSNPDFRTSGEVVAYLEKIRSLLSFAGVSDCKMQEGSMRCDVNLSVREFGTHTLGTRTEMKNMNSLKAIVRAIEYEQQRHIDALNEGTEILIQETRRWDDIAGKSYSMRNKENATDYRYFPNPDIPPFRISKQWIEEVRNALPEPADKKFQRLTAELNIPESEAKIIVGSKNLSDIFDALQAKGISPKDTVSWIVTDLLSMETAENKSVDDIVIDCGKFADLIMLVTAKKINRSCAKRILKLIYTDGVEPNRYVKDNNLSMVNDTDLIEQIVMQVLSENPDSVKQYQEGNQKVIAFFMGQIMKKTGGKADPNAVKELLCAKLGV